MRRFRNSVGPLIRKYRCQANLTQDGLAAKLQLAGLDMDRTAVAKIESRIRSVYDYELIVIARVLAIPPGKLFPSESDLRRILPHLARGRI
ncbi:MAG: helix-turn-helix transcriptional regulator [Kiritimatiellae bacterium]|nr:helix-turn-helix transcriptional regulator [Kiritimatiellia bacterium]